MIKIIDTYSQINSLFENGMFSQAKWESYINSIYDNSAHFFIGDLNECLDSGNYDYKKDVLSVLNAVYNNPKLEILHSSFLKIIENLNEKVINHFEQEINIDIVLYLGLCNGAGWVTNINDRDVILLGIEKILELNWYDEKSMCGLIYHELGHVYQKQYGNFYQSSDVSTKNFVWQLFIEGIAMYFEQVLVNDLNFYHQNKNDWLKWCENHFQQICVDFHNDLPTMTKSKQRYFGDWVNYYGKGDVGYFLGTKFVQKLTTKYDFNQLINLKIDDVFEEYLFFTRYHND